MSLTRVGGDDETRETCQRGFCSTSFIINRKQKAKKEKERLVVFFLRAL